jgi:predicted transcriptional regulator
VRSEKAFGDDNEGARVVHGARDGTGEVMSTTEGTTMTKLTRSQLEVLDIIKDGADYEPAEIWTLHSSYDNTPSHLGHVNFGRTMDNLVRRGLVERNDFGYSLSEHGITVVRDMEFRRGK